MPGKGNSQDLGPLEELILLAVIKIGIDAYAVPIQQMVDTVCRVESTGGGIYTALDRLEKKGLVALYGLPPRCQRGGRRRQCFNITDTGKEALKEAERRRNALRGQTTPHTTATE